MKDHEIFEKAAKALREVVFRGVPASDYQHGRDEAQREMISAIAREFGFDESQFYRAVLSPATEERSEA